MEVDLQILILIIACNYTESEQSHNLCIESQSENNEYIAIYNVLV